MREGANKKVSMGEKGGVSSIEGKERTIVLLSVNFGGLGGWEA